MQFMDTVGNYCDASKSTFGQIAETMSHIEKRVGIAIAQYLSNNTKDMDLFIGLPNEAKIVFVTNIMRKLASD
ncbi:hypothetical protein ACS0TY_023724 [Phlomoides rotata]